MKNNQRGSGNRKAVVLLSGGLDSATALYYAKKKGYNCLCLIFDYGQRHTREIVCARKIADAAQCPYYLLPICMPWQGSALLNKKISLPSVFHDQPGAITARRLNDIPVTYVPARNIIFLSFALSCAEAIGARSIFIGAHAQDYSGYPDCRPEFYRAFEGVIAAGTKAGTEHKKITVHTPLIDKTKAGIIRLGSSLGVPFELTWSCYAGGKRPCGKCDSCYFRAKGFEEAGIKDPVITAGISNR
ncbi:MAG: 7-cyano-7-deazaguanine synthase QueC [Candidatus Omnitrophica bacterium]|nr:7-cyano-7-deazaguanine synthase QueC [Candidatus Omnitrophota bacterium]